MSKLPDNWPLRPGDDLDAAIKWCTEQGLDAKRILRDGFRVNRAPDGSWVASGHLFDLDENGLKIVIENDEGRLRFAKTPFTQVVSNCPPFLVDEEVSA